MLAESSSSHARSVARMSSRSQRIMSNDSSSGGWSPKKETVKIDTPTNRTYKYLRTVKTEQELLYREIKEQFNNDEEYYSDEQDNYSYVLM